MIVLHVCQLHKPLYHNSALQSIQALWPTTEDIAAKIEGDTAELIGTAAVIEALQKAGLT